MNSELRQDLVSGDWILIAPGRGKRPDQFVDKKKNKKTPKSACLFEFPEKVSGGTVISAHPSIEHWRVQIVPNKYPVVAHDGIAAVFAKQGPYFIAPGVGHHDLVITKNHNKNFPKLNRSDANLLFQSFKDRYKVLAQDKYIAYVAIFHNWGHKAGASIYHPHYQMISIPVVPPDVEHSLKGSKDYFDKHNECVHCVEINWEMKERKRIIYENEHAVAFAPYVSRSPFEIRVFPKNHLSYFEDTGKEETDSVIEVLQKSLSLLEKSLNDPDYNFFIHTVPTRKKDDFTHYHWHIEIKPKISIPAGFELGTGIEINVVDPDEAAKFLTGSAGSDNVDSV
jgi:UDPglucose--hexose-1-phosphate uridylyltransferase